LIVDLRTNGIAAPKDVASLSKRSELLARQGKWREALDDADTIVHLLPDCPAEVCKTCTHQLIIRL